jgi:hypothetical protein
MSAHTVIRSLIVLAGLSLTLPAYANNYGIVTAGCVPTDAAVQRDQYRTGGHGVFIKGSGTARVICGIPITGGTWRAVDVYYKDPDGIGANYEVKVFLKSAALGSTSGPAICGVSSNARSATGYTSMRCEFSDFSPSASRWYWIEIQLFRRIGFTEEIEVLGVNVI